MKIGCASRPRPSRVIMALCLGILTVLLPGVRAGAGEPSLTRDSVIPSGAEYSYPPFSDVDAEGQPIGFAVELFRASLQAMGREASFRLGPWEEVRGWLEKGEIDALPLVGRTPERENLFDFTFPYMSLHGAIVVRRGTKGIQDLKDLQGRRVAVMKGDNAEEFLRREGFGMEIHSTPTFEDALRELSAGRHDAVVIQRLVGLRLLKESGLTNLEIINRPVEGFRQDFCFAVREGDRDTLALLNEGLALVMADGTYRHLHAKWFAALELPTHRRLVIGGDHRFPPYEFLDENGRPAGYNVDLTRAIAREMGLDIEIRLGPWTEVLKGLDHGSIDAVQGMFYSTERDLKYNFSSPHIVNHCVSVVRAGSGPPPATLEDLEGKRIVVQAGDIMHDFAVKNGLEARLTLVDSQEAALRELSEGRHDCALVARMTAVYLMEKNNWSHLKVGQNAWLSLEYGYAVPLNQKALLAHLNEGLKVLEKSGEYRRIQEKWFGVLEKQPLDVATIFLYVMMVAGPLLLVLAGSFVWSWSLRKQVARRTEELRRSEELQRAMILSSPLPIITLGLDGNVLAWNTAAERVFGWTADEVIGRPSPVIPRGREEEFEGLRRLLLSGEKVSGVEYFRRTKAGDLLSISLSAAPIYDAEGRIFCTMAFLEDISERKLAEEEREKLQRQMIQAQKMESVGRLAGGVAHDYNNMLCVIIGNAELAMEKVAPGGALHGDLGEILKAAGRSRDITKQLLAFARRQTIAPVVLDLNGTVEGMLKMLRRLIGEDIDLIWAPKAGLWRVRMDPAQLDQILANLCVNARDAIEGVGRITIETGNAFLDEAYCAVRPGFVPGDFVMLAVGDDGCGMDGETVSRIFEPFFTTKGIDEGTGLGLATVYGIVKQNNGFIDVESEPGKGSTFRIYLPRLEGEAQEEGVAGEAARKHGRGETVLLVEDEPAILQMGTRMLGKLGYEVLAAGGPPEALALAAAHTGEIHLLITDVVMPEVNGRDLANRLLQLHPRMRLLFMSGYPANVIAQRGILDEGVHFIHKPFSMQELAGKIREVLD
ncbi:MAG: transporter substrate-binding domain-containing protein [Syntrophobacteraceae bacterium]|nr:transporter substrate-binding domain-containing protein [Syntrophobacteraceae bacterium]